METNRATAARHPWAPAAAMWLSGSEPLLGGARPIDVLALEGTAPVIREIDAIAEGAYA